MSAKYRQGQDLWIEKHKIEVGSPVRILCKARQGQGGWRDSWIPKMTEAIGKIGTVHGNAQSRGLTINIPDFPMFYHFPYFILEPVTEEKEQNGHN